jgi:hypothetical protein
MTGNFHNTRVWDVPPKDPKNCWICGKPVSAKDAGIDELNFVVHAECTKAA